MGCSEKIIFIKDYFKNIILNNNFDLFYIIENANWSIKYDGQYIIDNLNKLALLKARISTSHSNLRNKIIHFGSINTFATHIHPSNKIILTIFHLLPNDRRLNFIIKNQEKIDLFHTSCNITRQILINTGINPKRIITIPLGVDLSLFSPVNKEVKKKIKNQLGIPDNKIIIGSFQKDGMGWKDGLTPKKEKGPDIFIKVIEKLAKIIPIFVLLTGPARGYIKTNLTKLKIPFYHGGYLKTMSDLTDYYHAIDLYLITSRVEGGPKAILESWACGIPVVSTSVGMIPDIAQDNVNVLLNDKFNIDDLVNKSLKIVNDRILRDKLISSGLTEVKKYNWQKISQLYYQQIYEKLL